MPIPENNPLQKSDPNPPKEVQHSNPYSSGGNFFSDLIRGPKLPDNIADLKKKEEIKKTEPVKEDWFKDRSLFHKSEIDQFFKNPKLRSELRQELGFSSTDEKKLREKIKYICITGRRGLFLKGRTDQKRIGFFRFIPGILAEWRLLAKL